MTKDESLPAFFSSALPFALAISVVFLGCDQLTVRPLASGPEAEIAVVIDSLNWEGEVGEALRSNLGGWILTLPAPEPAFDLVRRGLGTERDLNQLRTMKNVVFVAPLADSTVEAQFVRSAFSEEALQTIVSGGGGFVPRDDPWRRLQKVVFIAAQTPADLVQTISQSGEQLVDAFNEVARKRAEREMFSQARQFDLEEQLLDRHGFMVKAQYDYVVAEDTTDFVWLRRIVSSDSWRSLFVHYIDRGNPSELAQPWIVQVRDSIARQYVHGSLGSWMETDQRQAIESKTIELAGRFGVETRGLWQMMGLDDEGNVVQYGMGGPFVNYTFYDTDTGRIYMIDGTVFAPGYDKREFLRQMEVIGHTFQSRRDIERGGVSEQTESPATI